MKTVSRRDVLKTGLLVPAAAAVQGIGSLGTTEAAAESLGSPSATAMPESSSQNAAPGAGAGSERLLLDFGWRFHFGNSDDPSKDFGFGSGRTGNFQKTGNFLPAGAIAFDDGDWRSVDLPHDCAVELPFQNDPALASKGFYPLGRTYLATSVGWYRRSSTFPPRMPTNASRSSSTARIEKRWWCSTPFTSARIGAVTIRSVSM